MRLDQSGGWISYLGRMAKTLVLWMMLISGIVLATRQVRAEPSGSEHCQSSKRVFHLTRVK